MVPAMTCSEVSLTTGRPARVTDTPASSIATGLLIDCSFAGVGDERANQRLCVGGHLALELVGRVRAGRDVTDDVDLRSGRLAQRGHQLLGEVFLGEHHGDLAV